MRQLLNKGKFVERAWIARVLSVAQQHGQRCELPGEACSLTIVHRADRMPFSWMILPQRTMSALRNSANSSGVSPIGSAPSEAISCLISALRSMLASAECSLIKISRDVPFTAKIPFQPLIS